MSWRRPKQSESKNYAMQRMSVLVKTAKGLEEIDTRTHKLAGRLRALLFIIDGQRTLGELLDQAGNMAEQLEAQLQELAAQGFIEALGGAAIGDTAVTSPPPSPAPPASVQHAPANAVSTESVKRLLPIEELKDRLTKMVAESLGMRGMFMTAQVEGVKLHQELALVIDDIARSIALSSSVKVAEQWRQRARTLVEIPS